MTHTLMEMGVCAGVSFIVSSFETCLLGGRGSIFTGLWMILGQLDATSYPSPSMDRKIVDITKIGSEMSFKQLLK